MQKSNFLNTHNSFTRFLFFLFFLTSAFAWGQVDLVRWNNGTAPFPPSLVNANITASNITVAGGVTITPVSYDNLQNWFQTGSWPNGNDNGGGIGDASKYIEFTISPNAGYKIDLNTFDFYYQAQGTPQKFQVRYSKDDFESYETMIGETIIPNNNWTTASNSFSSVNPVLPGETVKIRIYAYNTWENFNIKRVYDSNQPNDYSQTPRITGTVTALPTEESDLQIEKTVDNDEPDIDDDVTFTLNVTNNGPDDATGVVVTDVLPIGYDFVSSTQGTYNAGNRTVTWNIGNLAASANTSFDIVATVLSSGTYNNTASVTANEPDPDTDNNSDTVTITPNIPTADLEITKIVDDDIPSVSQDVTFTLTVTNNGPDDATGVTVTDQLPNGYTYVSHNTATGSYDQGTGEWTIGNLTNGNSATLTVEATVLSSGNHTNTASVTANEYDPATGNNTDSVTPTVDYGTTDLAIQKIASHYGNDNNRYSYFGISVRNNGPNAATNIKVEDILNSVWNFSAQTYEVSHGTVTASGSQNREISWEIPYLPSGGVAVLLFRTGQNASWADPWNGGRNNTAEIISLDQTDSDPSNNSVTTMSSPYWSNHLYELGVSKSVNPTTPYIGEEVEFTIIVEKSGNTEGGPDSLELLDKLPPGYTYLSSNATRGSYDSTTGIWTVGSAWEWSGTETLIITAIVNAPTGQPDEYKNVVAIFSAGQFSDTEINNNMDSATIPTPVADPNGTDLSITKEVDEDSPVVGENVVFTLTATNNGDNNATGVVVTDLLPSGYEYVSDNGSGAYDDETGEWTIGNLNNGISATLDITATVLGTGDYLNTASIEGDNSDSDLNNNSDSATITSFVDLAITKEVDEDEPGISDPVVFTIEVENIGANPATGVVVKDIIPTGYNWVSNSQGTYDAVTKTVTWNVGDLAASATASFTITATVKANGNHINTATVSAEQPDNVPGNNSASVSTTPDLGNARDLKVVQSVSNEAPNVGTNVTFTITATNEGPLDATGVSVNTLLGNGLQYVSNTPPTTGSFDSGTGVWTISGMANAATATLTITATVLDNMGAAYLSIAEITGNEIDFDDNIVNNKAYSILSPVGQTFFPCEVNAETPAFYEDFGSGEADYAPELEPGRTNMIYMSGVDIEDGEYTVAKNAQLGYFNWQDISDPSGDPNGYFMIVNADIDPYEFFRTRITLSEEFCTNTRYNVNFKVINVNSEENHDYCSAPAPEGGGGYIEPEIGYFVINDKGEILGAGTSGKIIYDEEGPAQWKPQDFVFISGQDDQWVELVLFNKAPGGCGNDLAIDDIKISACMTPPIRLQMDIDTDELEVCGGETVTLHVDYQPDEDYVWPPTAWILDPEDEDVVQYQWQRSDDGINFTDISGETTDTYIIENFQEEDQDYYRLMYAQDGNIDKVFCRFPSAQYYPVFNATPDIPPIKIENDGPPYICGIENIPPNGAGTLQLYTDYDHSAYVECDENGENCVSTWGPDFYLWESSDPNVATIDQETGLITAVGTGTTTITYTVWSPKKTAACTTSVTKDISVFADCPSCVETPTGAGTDVDSPIGISTYEKQLTGWPENVPNGFIVLESKDKGFVITRVASDAAIAEPEEGMLVYNEADKCIKLYNGSEWHCIDQECDEEP